MTLDPIKMHQTGFDDDVNGGGGTHEHKENDNLSEPNGYICALAKGCFREKTLKLFNEHKDVLVNCLILIN